MKAKLITIAGLVLLVCFWASASFSPEWHANNIKTSTKCLFVLTNSVVVTNTTDETSIIQGSANGIGITNIPANFFRPGRKLIIKAGGVTSSPAITPGTLNIKIKYGSTTVIATGGQASIASAANSGWTLDANIFCRAAGANGVFVGTGDFRRPSLTLAGNIWPMSNPPPSETITADTTAAIPFDITVQFSIALGSSFTLQTLEILQFN